MGKFKEYLVGGAVRDELMGIKNKDLDYVFVFDELEPNKTTEECFNDMYEIIKTRGLFGIKITSQRKLKTLC